MTPITKTLALWVFAPMLAAGTLLPLTVRPASAATVSSENRNRDAGIDAQGGFARSPLAAEPLTGLSASAPDGFGAVPTECLHVHLDHGSC